MYNGYELALSENTLDEIINEKSVIYKLDCFDEYEKLTPEDKKALKYLVKAAIELDKVFLRQDCSKNIEMKQALQEAANSGDTLAGKALTLFKIFNGIEGADGIEKEPVRLFKGLQLAKGKNNFPEDLTIEELKDYLKKNREQIPAILSFDTIITRENDQLKALPYSIAFEKEYRSTAKELLEAAKLTTHQGLAKYLRLQAQALVCCDPEFAFRADEAWASLVDAPLEFTIGRESYEDTMTGALAEDKELGKILEENNFTIKSKDFIGVRVGIVDIEASIELADYKNHLRALADLMPLREQYTQSIELGDSDNVKQTLSDVDLVYLSGDYAALRPGITLAQNLPNDDKLAVQLECGNRNVFHKQVRRTFDPERRQKMLDALVDKSFHDYYDREADHFFTIGHELTHSLGPMSTLEGRDKKVALGDGYGDIIEECKADVGALVGLGYFKKIGKYTPELLKKILLTWAVDQMPLSEPTINQAHRVRELMQFNYFIEKGAIKMASQEKISVNFDKMVPVARQMLEDIINLQLKGDARQAKAYVEQYSQWNETCQYVSKEKKKLKPKPYKILKAELAEKILAE